MTSDITLKEAVKIGDYFAVQNHIDRLVRDRIGRVKQQQIGADDVLAELKEINQKLDLLLGG